MKNRRGEETGNRYKRGRCKRTGVTRKGTSQELKAGQELEAQGGGMKKQVWLRVDVVRK